VHSSWGPLFFGWLRRPLDRRPTDWTSPSAREGAGGAVAYPPRVHVLRWGTSGPHGCSLAAFCCFYSAEPLASVPLGGFGSRLGQQGFQEAPL